MYLSSQDALHLAIAISVVAVSGFLCWVLYELARMLREANIVVREVHDKVNRVEMFISEISEKVSSASQYIGVLAMAGKEIFGWVKNRKQADTDEDDTFVARKKSKRS